MQIQSKENTVRKGFGVLYNWYDKLNWLEFARLTICIPERAHNKQPEKRVQQYGLALRKQKRIGW